MNSYYYQSICLNGHQNSIYGESEKPKEKYCSKCGQENISCCLSCHKQIAGRIVNGWPLGSVPIPYYCSNCSEPFPWTKSLIDNAVELVSLDKKLKDSDKELIKNALPNLLVDSIETPVSQAKIKILMDKMSSNVLNMFVQLLSQFINKTLLEQLTN